VSEPIRETVRSLLAPIEAPRTAGQATALANALLAESQAARLLADDLRRRGAQSPDPPEKGEPGTKQKG
jgi:hypothetical protein